MTKRTWLVPEIVQTSAMDCGPAALAALLEGYGIPVSYGRLREACQTDVDGTSIDEIERAAVALGLDAAQMMVPADHLPLRQASLLPCLVVVRQPTGATHFVIAWRRHARWIEVMDPAVGRRFVSIDRFLRELYIHTTSVAAASWREWAASESFRRPLEARMKAIGVPGAERRRLIDAATADPGCERLARLDAAVRMLESIACGGGLGRGRTTSALLQEILAGSTQIPAAYWTVQPDSESPGHVRLSGAVLISVTGRSASNAEARSPELEAALGETQTRPGVELWRLLRADGAVAPVALLSGLAGAAAGLVVEALLLRGLFDLAGELTLSGQRLGAIGFALGFLVLMLALEWTLLGGCLRLGRTLEVRLRHAFLTKIPRLGDRYFQSRLTSDMAERNHMVHHVRSLPELASNLTRAAFEMALTVAAIAWLFPGTALLAASIGAIGVLAPLFAQPALAARDLRWRTHGGALSRFYLDAMMGLVAVRAHGAERALRREQESLLGEWARAGLHMQKAVVAVDGVQFLLGFGLASWLLFRHLEPGVEPGGALLLAYWTLNLPALGQEIGTAAWQYPGLRNVTLRLLEPLGAPEEAQGAVRSETRMTAGVRIELMDVTVRAGGHRILDRVSVRVKPGEHVAIVGASGAGKSSLAGLLLGWHRPSEGRVTIDGEPLEAAMLAMLRRHTAWVDPQVQLWNRTLAENLRYGSSESGSLPLGDAVAQADLQSVLRTLPDGLQTVLGEGGALVSGGEGQRVRFGRALTRGGVRLAILDEPARGLDREKRRLLVGRAQDTWSGSTLLCITHDVEDTLGFGRVLVMDQGRIVEDGDPRDLAMDTSSRYRALLDAEHAVRRGLWSSGVWRRLNLEDGRLTEDQLKGATCPEMETT